MSQDARSKTKEKKARRDAERRHKGKKRNREEVEPEDKQDELQQDFIPLVGEADKSVVKSKTKSRKRKAQDEGPDRVQEETTSSEPKSKRRKKTKLPTIIEGSEENDDAAATPVKPSQHRFIVFVGNLPYSTTEASLRSHFQKLQPFTIRHRTDPQTKRSKGFAFLEFENYDRMKTCLKLYHHSMFDATTAAGTTSEGDGESTKEVKGKKVGGKKKDLPRRINVELTAGGGGSKAEGRKEKIKVKNVRLEEQRKRRAEVERKEKGKERREKGGAGGKLVEDANGDENAGMHPSRLARIQN